MTRINTNVSSLVAQQNLQKSNNQLQTALTRLSTGYRINSGKDDPAGMIAAAQLGSQISSTNAAIGNSESAQQMIDTADSSLSQVTSLLNDIRALITKTANDGAMSADQIAANQEQVNSSLDAINRIAQTTNFQGRNLLDGSMGYIVTRGTGYDNVIAMQVDTATLGTNATMAVSVEVTTAATQAELYTTVATGGAAGTYRVTVNHAGASEYFDITAPTGTDYTFSNMTVQFATTDSSTVTTAAPQASYDVDTNTLTIITDNSGTTTWTAIQSALAHTAVVEDDGTGNKVTSTTETLNFGVSGATAGASFNTTYDSAMSGTAILGNTTTFGLNLTANATGAALANSLNYTINYVDGATSTVSFNSTTGAMTLNIGRASTDAIQTLVTAINSATGGTMTATITSGDGSATIASLGIAAAATGVATNTISTKTSVGAVASTGYLQLKGLGIVAITAKTGGSAGNITVVLQNAASTATTTTASMVDASTMVVSVADAQNTTTDIANAITTGTDFAAVSESTGSYTKTVASSATQALLSGNLTLTAKTAGAAGNSLTYTITRGDLGGAGSTATYDASGNLTIAIDTNAGATTRVGALLAQINSNGVGVQPETMNATVAAAVNLNALAATEFAAPVGATSLASGADGDGSVAAASSRFIGTTDATHNAVALTLTAKIPGATAGTLNYNITNAATATTTAVWNSGTNTLTVDFGTDYTGVASTKTFTDLLTLINGVTGVELTASVASTDSAKLVNSVGTITGMGAAAIVGAIDTDSDAGTVVASDETTSVASLTHGANAVRTATVTDNSGATAIGEALNFRLTGATGSYAFNFEATVLLSEIVNAVNLQSDATGVTASTTTTSAGATRLVFDSSAYGTAAFVAVDMINNPGTSFEANMKDRNGNAAMRTTGTDIVAKVNGTTAQGDGNTLKLNTATLSMTMTVDPSTTVAGTAINFTIDGGGAMFQLGAEVNTVNQANIGIASVDTSNLGGTSGLLYQLRSGQSASLTSDNLKVAAEIADQALNQISTLRGRLGAFQKTTVETNINTLNDTVTALTSAQSSIQDADFAAETANLTRAQVLVQSGTAVLQIANRQPQNVLALLQG